MQIKERTRIERGCLIADNVVVGPQARLAPFSRLSKRRSDGDEDNEDDDDDTEQADDEDEDDENEDDDEDSNDEDEDEVDSELEEVEASEYSQCLLQNRTECFLFSQDQDAEALAKLGADTNALIWPPPTVHEDEEVDELEHPDNQRLMRIGTSCSSNHITCLAVC